jgi:hypothetical protein
MQSVTARTAHWPMNAPEQPATAMGAMATRYQGVSFIRGSLRRNGRRRKARCCGDLHVSEATTSDGWEPNFYRLADRSRKEIETDIRVSPCAA